MSLRNSAINTSNINGGTGGGANTASMPYYNQNGFYVMGGSMYATEQDQSYYKNMFIELGFGEPNPPVAQHLHQGSMAYPHHMQQHANYGH